MKIWAILGARAGDNNQVLALAEALGLPFECKRLAYNRWRHLGPRLLGATFVSLTTRSRASVTEELPDLTISTGHRSVPVVQALRRRSGGSMRSIHVGYPRISPGNFDLVIATPEYPIPDHPNLLRIPFALTRQKVDSESNPAFWNDHPTPRRLLILGGPTLYWKLGEGDVLAAVGALLSAAHAQGGSVLVIGSPRTPPRLLMQVATQLSRAETPAALVATGGAPSYAELLNRADSIAVTADSVAMVSEAIATGKPVGMLSIEPTIAGGAWMRLMDRVRPGRRLHPRDLRVFWEALDEEGLIGSVEEPKRGQVPDLNGHVARRVKDLLNLEDN